MTSLKTTREYRDDVRSRANRLQCELGKAFHVRYWPTMSLVPDGEYLTLGDGDGEGSIISVEVDEDLADLAVTLDASRPETLREQAVAEMRRVAAAYTSIADDIEAGRLTPISESERAAKDLMDDHILEEFDCDDLPEDTE